MSTFQHLGCLVLATEGREQRVRDEAAPDHFVQQHLSLKSTWDRARRTQHGLFSIFPVSTLIFWGSNTSLVGSREGGNVPLRALHPTWGCSQGRWFFRQVFLPCANTLRSLKEGIYPFLQGAPPSQHQLDNLPISLRAGITLECFKKQVGCVTPGKPELLPSAVPSAGISAAMGRTRASSWCKRASAESS